MIFESLKQKVARKKQIILLYLLLLFSLQAGPSRHVDDQIIIEFQKKIRDLQEKLDSVGSYEVRVVLSS